MTQKIVINTCYGGFSLSEKALTYLGIEEGEERTLSRDDARLVEVVSSLREAANGRYAFLKVIKIPDGVKWTIEDYDGKEHIAEVHRTWR